MEGLLGVMVARQVLCPGFESWYKSNCFSPTKIHNKIYTSKSHKNIRAWVRSVSSTGSVSTEHFLYILSKVACYTLFAYSTDI